MSTPRVLHCYILSDSIGKTALEVAKANLGQFPGIEARIHSYNFIKSYEAALPILETCRQRQGILYYTVVSNQLAAKIKDYTSLHGLLSFNLMQPFLCQLADHLELTPTEEAGAQRQLDSAYFRRIKALEFCLAHDDGKQTSHIGQADILLLGISRIGKTPLTLQLGMMGFKTMNLPLLPEVKLAEGLDEVDPHRIIGLTNEVDVIVRHRQSRMREYDMPATSRYASPERVREELDYAYQVYERLQCPVLSVAGRSVEESANMIINRLGLEPPY